jgi:hypothetical protein
VHIDSYVDNPANIREVSVRHVAFLIKALLVCVLERIFSFFPSLSVTPGELIQHSNFRYEYAVYNMNSERGVGSFSVPVGMSPVTNIGMSSVLSHGEPWSNDPWQSKVENGRLTFATKTFQESENANAIRWGTTYNFWFETDSPPAQMDAQLGRFKPGNGPAVVTLKVQGPKG